jgi:transposase
MIKKHNQRRFSREFKLAAVRSMAAGVNISQLSRDLGISRNGLYKWRDQFSKGGATALRGAGRPIRDDQPTVEDATIGPSALAPGVALDATDELAKAQAWIIELERTIGQQAVDLDFFRQALRRVEGARHSSGAPGGTASTRSSRR